MIKPILKENIIKNALIIIISMLLTALILESMVLAIKIVYPSFFIIILIFSFLLYTSIALYDFWDLNLA